MKMDCLNIRGEKPAREETVQQFTTPDIHTEYIEAVGYLHGRPFTIPALILMRN